MGRTARAALAVAAPEVAAARQITPGMSPGEVNDELQRRRAARAARAATPGHPMVPTAPPASPASPPPASPGGGLSLPSLPMPAAAATGSGFLLGVFSWALALAYLRGGPDGVRKFLSAKFLNKV